MNFLSRTLIKVAATLARWDTKVDPTGNALVAFVKGQVVRMGDTYVACSREGYNKNAIVKSVVTKIAKCLAHTKVKLQRHRPEDGKWEDLGSDEDDEHPLMMLMNKPNPSQSGFKFWGDLMHQYLLSGGCFMTGNGPNDSPPTELWYMRPDRMEIVPGENNIPKEYIFNCNSQMVHFPVKATTGESPVFEMRMFNPLDDWKLSSPLKSAALQIDQYNYAAEWNMANLQAGGRPQGGFKYTPGSDEMPFLDRNTRKKLERDIDQRLMGPKNARRPLVMDGGIEWQDFSMSAVEMDWLEGARDAARTICLVYGVPPQLLGIPGDNTFANYSEARLSFYEETVIPLLQELLDALNGWLVPKFGDDLRLAIDMESIAALFPQRQELFTLVEAANFMTLNEKRKIVGMEPLDKPEADEVWMPSGLTPMSVAADPTAGMLDENGDPISGGPADKKPKPGDDPNADPEDPNNSGAAGGKPKGRGKLGGGKPNGKKPAAPVVTKLDRLFLSIKSMSDKL